MINEREKLEYVGQVCYRQADVSKNEERDLKMKAKTPWRIWYGRVERSEARAMMLAWKEFEARG